MSQRRSARANFVKSPEEKISEMRENNTIDQLQFPSDLGAYGFIMNFQEFDFNAGQVGASANGVKLATPVTISTKESIILPIPSPLQQAYGVAIEDTKTGPFVQAAARAIAASVATDPEADTDILNELRDTFGSDTQADSDQIGGTRAVAGVRKLLGNKLGRKLSSTILSDSVFATLEQAVGSIYNPSNIAAFKGTPLRKHTLNWKLSPRNAAETITLNKIVSKIRKKMHASLAGTSDDGLFLQTYPDILQCALITPDKNQNIFYKPGLIQNFVVDHSGNEQTNFFAETGSPVQYDIKLEFMELDYITREDFGDDEDGGIN